MGIYSRHLYRVLGERIKSFFNLIPDRFLSQHVLEPTRGKNVLDICLSSQNEFVDNVKICEPLGCSDHNQIHVIVKVKGERNRKIRYRKHFHKGLTDYLGQLIVTPTMVAMKIRHMKDNKSPGVDGIPPKLLLEIVEQISIPLATVFNLALEEGVVPLEWKEANIIPLFKKGSRSKSENYRPVSLTSVICKLLQRLIKGHLVDFLVKNKLINPSQHEFLKARSCLTNMLCFLEDVTKWVDEGSPVDIIYLD